MIFISELPEVLTLKPESTGFSSILWDIRDNSQGVINPHILRFMHQRKAMISSRYYMNMEMPLPELEKRTKAILQDPECGNVIRIKGFTETVESRYEINATKDKLEMKPVEKGQAVLIVIGENLNKEKIDTYFRT